MASSHDPLRERTSMARAAALLLVAGSVLGLTMLLVPHSQRINAVAYDVIDALVLIVAALVWLLRERLPIVAYHLVGAFAIVCISFAIYYSGNRFGGAAENELLYLWPILYACYFLSRRGLGIQLGIVGVSYAVVLAAIDAGSAGVARWVGVMGTVVAAAVFVRWLKERHDRDISLQRATIESTADGVLVVDEKGRWESFNSNFVQMWRIPADIVRTRNDDAAIDFVLDQLEDPASFIAKIRELYETPDAESLDEIRFKDGRVFERYSQPQRVDQRTVGRVWSFSDVTQQKQAEERLQHLADHDSLTDLLNRRRFKEELQREISRADRYRRGGALLLLDLDNFKVVNDTHGHIWGDEVLRGAARLLRSRVRSSDILARLGGDEFAVLLPEADEVRARKLAEELLEKFREHTIDTDQGEVGVSTSIGVVTLDAIGLDGPDPLVAADGAMYQAKREGRNRLVVYGARATSPGTTPTGS
jgi:diguanylate cyclase (GGDEF)-like protein/PAS domain S-box-containing protein